MSGIRRMIIVLFCVAIGLSTGYVMLEVYDPGQNTMRALSSVSMDVTCIIILFVVVGSFVFGDYASNKTTRLFEGLLLGTVWAMFLDFLNWAFDGILEYGKFTYYFTVGSFCMGSVLAGVFVLYLAVYMEETHNLIMRKHANVCLLLDLVSFVLSLVFALSGTAFKFVDGHYETGALYDVVTMIPILTLLYLTGYVIVCVKKVGIRDVIAVAGYIFFMIAGALIEAEYSIGTTYVSVAIADVFIFVMLQNAIIANEQESVQEWKKKSNTDQLTGFWNRHAYESDLLQYDEETPDKELVYVSMDVNSLKAVNDSLGHNVGDELIIGAAECIRKCFGWYGRLYRVGGDEFVALIKVDGKTLAKVKKNIEQLTKKWGEKNKQTLSISCGYVVYSDNKKMTVRQMAIEADKRMYAAKKKYYEK